MKGLKISHLATIMNNSHWAPVPRDQGDPGEAETPPWRTLVCSQPLKSQPLPGAPSPLLVAVTGADMADGHRGQQPLLRDKANRGGGHADMDMPFKNNSVLLVHCYWGLRFILTFWGYQLFMIVLYGLLGVLGLDRAGVQDLIISGQLWERSWCWPIGSLPLFPWPMGGQDRGVGSWLFL